MLRYNTQLKPLILPEYGRNIQSMVDHCLTIEDRQERTNCAYSIVAAMANLFPELKAGGEYSHKLWDHLAIMSEFKLDIDYPTEIIQPDSLQTVPDRIEYSGAPNFRRHYGKTIEAMIDKAASMADGEEKDELIRLIANQMKKAMTDAVKDGVEDERIFRDIFDISEGRIHIMPEDLKLHDYIIPAQPTGKKKKKK